MSIRPCRRIVVCCHMLAAHYVHLINTNLWDISVWFNVKIFGGITVNDMLGVLLDCVSVNMVMLAIVLIGVLLIAMR